MKEERLLSLLSFRLFAAAADSLFAGSMTELQWRRPATAEWNDYGFDLLVLGYWYFYDYDYLVSLGLGSGL